MSAKLKNFLVCHIEMSDIKMSEKSCTQRSVDRFLKISEDKDMIRKKNGRFDQKTGRYSQFSDIFKRNMPSAEIIQIILFTKITQCDIRHRQRQRQSLAKNFISRQNM
jgi:hypothetical protein